MSCVEEPAATLKGAGGVTVKSGLELVMAVTFKVAFPPLSTLVVRVAELKAVTEPKLSGAGETAMTGAGGGVPAPPNPTNVLGCNKSLLVIVRIPFCEPGLVGLNRTEI